jgi:four helix bundle protein
MRQFLRYAIASNGEVRNCFYAAKGRKYLSETEADVLIVKNNSIGKMLRRFDDSLEDY